MTPGTGSEDLSKALLKALGLSEDYTASVTIELVFGMHPRITIVRALTAADLRNLQLETTTK